jgi:hypothetical protein
MSALAGLGNQKLQPCVFIIGFNKCGTHTLNHFFEANSFPSIRYNKGKIAIQMTLNCISGKKVLDGYDDKFRVFSDLFYLNNKVCIEGNRFFRNMDKDYPNSYFIYNTRDMKKWIESRSNAVPSLLDRYKNVYGTPDVEEIKKVWMSERLQFESELDKYFKDHGKFMVLDIESEMAASNIRDFLSIDMDLSAWKWLGRTQDRVAAWNGRSNPLPASSRWPWSLPVRKFRYMRSRKAKLKAQMILEGRFPTPSMTPLA